MAKYKTMRLGNGERQYRTRINMPDGSRKALYGRTTAEIDQKLEKLKHEIAIQENATTVTLREYAQTQLEIMKANVSRGTYVGYESKVNNYIIKPLGDKLLCDITADDIKLATARITSLSSSSCRVVHMLIRRIFGAAVESGLLEKDPTETLRIKSQQQPREQTSLSEEETKVLLDAIAGLPVERFVRIALFAGLRREEILALKWDSVFLDEECPYIHVRRAWRIERNRPVISEKLKTKAAKRIVPIPYELGDFLREIKESSSSDYVVSDSTGNPLTGTQWRSYWKQVTNRKAAPRTYTRYTNGKKEVHTVTPVLGSTAYRNPSFVYSIPFHIRPHQLRHTYITNLVARNVDPKTVQYLAGHENIKMTMDVYAKVKYNQPQDLGIMLYGKREK